MKHHSVSKFAIILTVVAVFSLAPTPAHAWPHHKSAHVTARFVGIDTKPSSVTVYFVPSNGKKSTAVHTDVDGKISANLRPGRYVVTVKNDSADQIFKGEYVFGAGKQRHERT